MQGTDFRRIALSLSAGLPYPNRYASWRDYVIRAEPAPYGKESNGQVRGPFALSILGGGLGAADRAGCVIIGGHSIEDPEPKYGLAVIGTVTLRCRVGALALT